MNQEFSYTDVMEMLPAYVLGALEADEMLAVEEYLQRHRLLLERLQALEESTAQLALTAPAASPPQRVKAALMARVREEVESPSAATFPRQESAISKERRVLNPLLRRALTGSKPGQPLQTSGAMVESPRPGQPAGRRFNFGWAAAALTAAVMLLAIFLTNVFYQSRLEALQQELALKEEQLQAANQQIEVLEQQFLGAQNQLAAFTQPDRVIPLTGTEAAPEVRGVFLKKDATGILLVRGLQPLAASQTYQLWLIPAEGAPISAGLLERDVLDASGVRTVTIPQEAENFAAVGISIEPEGGSPAPTGPIVALG